jgi:hypothetical protein
LLGLPNFILLEDISMQNAPVVVNNDSAVAKTFTPVVVSGETVIFEDLTASTVAARNRMVTRPGRFTKTRPTDKPSFGVELPLIRTIDSVPTVVGTIRINADAIYPTDATATEVKDAYAFFVNGLGDSLIKAQFRDRDYTT